MCRTLLVDDDEDMRVLARTLIDLTDGVTLAAEAVDADSAVDAWHREHYDVVVLDHRMPGRTGLEVAELILGERPDQHVVLFSAYLDDATVRHAERLGVRACVSKDRVTELPDAIRRYCAAP